jgi:hypothetical protein
MVFVRRPVEHVGQLRVKYIMISAIWSLALFAVIRSCIATVMSRRNSANEFLSFNSPICVITVERLGLICSRIRIGNEFCLRYGGISFCASSAGPI